MKKFILLFLIVHCASFFVHCYAQEIEWQNTIGGNGFDILNSIQQTSDDGYILAGWSASDSSGDKTENSIGGSDYWIIKLDSIGNIQWQNTIGGGSGESCTSIEQTLDGGYILGGQSASDSSDDKTENNWDTTLTTADYWIVKLDSLGTIQWQNTIGGDSGDYLSSIHQTVDGGYIAGGYSISGLSGDKTENCQGLLDYWILKLDSLGNIQWQNTIGGNFSDFLNTIIQTSDGGYICGGESRSSISGDKTEDNWDNSTTSGDYWVLKLDATGNIQWQNTIGGIGADVIHSIHQTLDGSYILGGYSQSGISGDKTENSNGYFDYWLVKIDGTGNIQWQNTIGGNDNDWLFSTQLTTDGGYVLGGYSRSDSTGDKTEGNIGLYDYWVVKTDENGNIIWQNTIGGSDEEKISCVQQTSEGGYILGGSSRSDISGDKTENSIGTFGYDDYWVVKLKNRINTITGKLFIDANSNNVQDTGEPTVANKKVTETNTGIFSFSQNAGIYYINVLDSGNFSVSPAAINYYNPVPANHTAYFSGINQTDSLNDFAFQPAGVFNDLCITITPLGAFRAGMNASYMINYENVGTTTHSPTVIFFPDNDVTFVSANPVASAVTVDSVVWNFGVLAPFQTGSILVTVNVTIGTTIGTLINSGVRIEPVAGDANTACNYSYWEVLTTGSVDPNAIFVDEDTVFTTQLSNPPYLEYIIYFQNTGNDTAFTVKVLNPVDTFMLQLNTFEFVASSHPVNITYKPWERNFEFMFDNILLPDSNVNEPASHGFVRYRIKPKTTLVAGDEIQNTAYIYFDFNAPVQTNVAVTEVVQFTGLSEVAGGSGRGQVVVYPNPAKDEFTIHNSQFTIEEIKIYDLFGREVMKMEVGGQSPDSYREEVRIDVSGLVKGIYVVEVRGEGVYRGKFVKQ